MALSRNLWALALVSLLWACDARTGEVTAVTLDDLAVRLGLRFPPSAELLAARGESGLDDALFAKVALPADDWAAFVAQEPLASLHFTEDARYLLGPDDAWWDPQRQPSLPTAQAPLGGGGYLNIGVDRSHPERVVLYVLAHST